MSTATAAATAAAAATTTTTSAPERPRPDVSRYYLIHRAMRTANAQLLAAVEALRERDWRRANALARWFEGYAGELRAHHHVEDDLFFPALLARVPETGVLMDVLAADHRRLDEVIDALITALGTLAQGRSAWAPDHELAVSLARELRDLLAPHLDIEDRDVIPLFEARFAAEEYEALDRSVLKEMSLKQLLFTVPWLMATVDPETAAHEIATAPLPLRVIWRLTRRRYARLVRRGFGTI